jgi:muramoyltetrapeptide carboxypeptidase
MDSAASLGWRVTVGRHALARDGYFAGSDADRAQDLVAAMLDDDIDAIWCLRGGYGAMRLLPQVQDALDRTRGRVRPQALIGYSDITALHAAWQRAGWVSYHGPTARASLTAFTRASFVSTVQDGSPGRTPLVAPQAIRMAAGSATGKLAGGNLALVAALCGTPWAMDFRGAIVVLEDIDEATYRIDRMLTQLRLAGAFDGCVGVAFGQFTNCPDTTSDGSRSLDLVLRDVAEALQVPTLSGIPVGHIEDQWTLPLGALATLDADAGTLAIHRVGPASP